jgi:hypothetical protein
LIGLLGTLAAGLVGTASAAISLQAALAGALLIIPLLVEDFIVWLDGGESMVGKFVDRFAGSDGLLGAFADFANWMRTDGLEVWRELESVVGNVIDWLNSAFGEFFRNFMQNIATLTEGLMNIGRLDYATQALETEERIAELDEELGRMQQVRLNTATAMVRAYGGAVEDYMQDLVTAEERAGRRERAALVIQSEAFGARGVGARSVGMEGLMPTFTPMERTAVASGANVSVGEVSVSIGGTTGMGPEEVSAAVAEGVTEAMNPALRQAERLTSDTGNVF